MNANGMGCIIGAVLIVLVLSIGPLCIMWLWNWIMPHLFNLPEINFWMALGISVLSSLIFGGRAYSKKE